MNIGRYFILIGLIFLLFLLSGCNNYQQTPIVEVVYPTPADNLPELIVNLSSDNLLVQIASTREIYKYGKAADAAIPILINNLYADASPLRISTIVALDEIGEGSIIAVPDLIWVLENDEHPIVRRHTASTLGNLGDSRAIPVLASILYQEDEIFADEFLPMVCADAIARITGENFTDAGESGFTLDDEGVPLILLDAKKWWEELGQFQDWPPIDGN